MPLGTSAVLPAQYLNSNSKLQYIQVYAFLSWRQTYGQCANKLLAAMLVSQTGDGALYYLWVYQYVLILINRVLLSCRKSKHSIPKVITDHYIITLRSAARLLKLDILSPFFYYELLPIGIIPNISGSQLTTYLMINKNAG